MTDTSSISAAKLTRRATGLGLLGAIAACSQPASAQISRASPLALRRGIGVHHMLNWAEFNGEEYRWPPFARADYQSSDEEIANLRRVGFDFVRLTVAPDIFMASNGRRSRDLAEILIDRVERFRAHELSVIVDLHPTSRNPAYSGERLWNGAGSLVFRRYVEVVGEVAATLARYDAGVAFELMNEPQAWGMGAAQRWHSMNARMIAAARAEAPTLPLIVSGHMSGGYMGLIASEPFADERLIYTFHHYGPSLFTHQTAIEEARHMSKLPWPPSEGSLEAELEAMRERVRNDRVLSASERARSIERGDQALREYFNEGNGPSRIAADFAAVARWADAYGIARGAILLGEFGVVRFHRQYRGAIDAHRTHWLRLMREAAEANGFAWSVWTYRGDGGMALVDEEDVLAFDQPSLRALGLNAG